jgi:hypothetical protein
MAVTADTVEVRLEANVSKYLSDLKSADVQSSKAFGQIAAAATSAAGAITKEAVAAQQALRASGTATKEQLAAAAATVQKARATETATRAEVARVTALRNEAAAQISVGAAAQASAGQVAASTAQTNAATNNLSLNTANIAAQFQDIGVTAAMGMNPLQIALQQGTQLSAVLNESVSRGVSPVKALGAAFAQIVNPISLATIAAIALGAAVLQGIGEIVPKTVSATEAIKRHREELGKVVKGYEAAEDAVDEYTNRVGRLPKFAVSEGIRKSFEELEETTARFNLRLADLEVFLNHAESGVGPVGRELGALVTRFNAGEISARDFYTELGKIESSLPALDRLVGNLGGGVGALVTELRNGTLALVQFGDAAQNALAASFADVAAKTDTDLQNVLDLRGYIAEQERINGLTTEQLQLEKEIARIKADAGKLGITDERAAELARQTLEAEKRRAEIARQLREGGKSGDSAAREYERERQAIDDLLQSLGFEAALLGQTNREKAIAIALSKANATATEEELRQIEQMAGFIYDTEQAINELNSTSQEWADTIQSATRGFIDDLIAGKDAAEAFSNVLSNIASKLIDMGLNSLFGTGGFNLAGLFGGTSTLATGGPAYAGNPTLVGERGPELFIPSTPGKIVPNSQVGGGGSVVFAPNIDARGADVAAVARLERAVQDMASQIIPTIRREIAVGPKKGR